MDSTTDLILNRLKVNSNATQHKHYFFFFFFFLPAAPAAPAPADCWAWAGAGAGAADDEDEEVEAAGGGADEVGAAVDAASSPNIRTVRGGVGAMVIEDAKTGAYELYSGTAAVDPKEKR